jgi:hypothetical protein
LTYTIQNFIGMTLYEFIGMDESDQAEAIWSGVFIGERETNNFRILLYSIDEFYVEVFYDDISNEIKRFRPFTTLLLLEPYLDKIDLNGMF